MIESSDSEDSDASALDSSKKAGRTEPQRVVGPAAPRVTFRADSGGPESPAVSRSQSHDTDTGGDMSPLSMSSPSADAENAAVLPGWMKLIPAIKIRLSEFFSAPKP